MKITRRRITAILGAVVAGLLLAACGGTPSPTTTTDTSTAATVATVATTSENLTPSNISSPTPDLAAAVAEAARMAAESSAAVQSAAESSAAAQSAADQAAADKAAADQAAADQAAADQAAADEAAEEDDASRLTADQDKAAGLQDAATAAGWLGPVCSPDTNLHRERADQPLATNAELASECEARIAEAEALIAGR